MKPRATPEEIDKAVDSLRRNRQAHVDYLASLEGREDREARKPLEGKQRIAEFDAMIAAARRGELL